MMRKNVFVLLILLMMFVTFNGCISMQHQSYSNTHRGNHSGGCH